MSAKLGEKALMTALRRRVPTPPPLPSVRQLDLMYPTPPQSSQTPSQEAGRLRQKRRKFLSKRMQNVWKKVPQHHPLYSGTGLSSSAHVGVLPPLQRAPKAPRECKQKMAEMNEMEQLKKLTHNVYLPSIRFADLNKGQKYSVTRLHKANTMYGLKLVATIDGKQQTFLPSRTSEGIIRDQSILSYLNKKIMKNDLSLIVNDSKSFDFV
uniref:Uncharacterized protein n=1 Tax=Trichogramma kaykai TaxID=54128 RepID=A0ABD2VUH5_9HYME